MPSEAGAFDRGLDRPPGDGDRSAGGVGIEVVGDPRARGDRHLDDRDRRADPVGERGRGAAGRARRRRRNAVGLLTEFLPAFDGEQLIRPTKGPSIPVLTQAVMVPAEPEPLLTVFARDISERKQFEEQLAHQARHDALTGLPNRFAVLEHLENVLLIGDDQCAVMFVDIDGFKSVNDSHGHATGDLVLREIADRIRGRVRPGDFVARLGGDEFLIVMRGFEDMTAVASFGYRLIREIEQPFRFGDHLFAVSASVGLTLPEPGSPAMIAVQQADAAVYLAKRRGRGRVQLYDHDLQVSIEAAGRARAGTCGKRSATTSWSSTSSRSSMCSRASAGAPRRSCAGTVPASARSRRRTSSPSPSAAPSSSTSSGGC